MADPANSADQKRTGPGGPVPADLPGHHYPKADDRGRRQQERPIEVRETRQIGHQVQIRSCLTVQLPSASPQGLRVADHCETIASNSCKWRRNRSDPSATTTVRLFSNLRFVAPGSIETLTV